MISYGQKMIIQPNLSKDQDLSSILHTSRSLPSSLSSIPKLLTSYKNFLRDTNPEAAIVESADNKLVEYLLIMSSHSFSTLARLLQSKISQSPTKAFKIDLITLRLCQLLGSTYTCSLLLSSIMYRARRWASFSVNSKGYCCKECFNSPIVMYQSSHSTYFSYKGFFIMNSPWLKVIEF